MLDWEEAIYKNNIENAAKYKYDKNIHFLEILKREHCIHFPINDKHCVFMSFHNKSVYANIERFIERFKAKINDLGMFNFGVVSVDRVGEPLITKNGEEGIDHGVCSNINIEFAKFIALSDLLLLPFDFQVVKNAYGQILLTSSNFGYIEKLYDFCVDKFYNSSIQALN